MARKLRRTILRALLGLGAFCTLVIVAVTVPMRLTSWERPTLRAAAGPQGAFPLAGAVHVHSEKSRDSRTTTHALVAAATAAGLSFLILTDHDVPAEPARFVDGILILSQTEWSNYDGHVLDLSETPGKGPFPSASDAVADCLARGGPCISSHPTSARRKLAVDASNVPGFEIHGAMTSLGDLTTTPVAGLWMLLRLLGDPAQALWSLGASDDAAVALIEHHAQTRSVSSWCGPDAHGHIPLQENLLAYLTLVDSDGPLPGDAMEAAEVLRARLPRAACVNALAGPVDGLMLRRDGAEVVADVQAPGVKWPAKLRLTSSTCARMSEAPLHAGRATLRSMDDGCVWRAELIIRAEGTWGAVERSGAIRILPASSGR